jgi:hypothetical protein
MAMEKGSGNRALFYAYYPGLVAYMCIETPEYGKDSFIF